MKWPLKRMKYRIGNYLDLAYLIPMLRRYLVLGTFDGLLTSISVIVASFLSNASPHQTISVTLSALIGISAASAANAFVVELQEYKKEISRPVSYTHLTLPTKRIV